MGYAVLHLEKGSGSGRTLSAHITREKGQEHTFRTADPARLHLNQSLVDRYPGATLDKGVKTRIAEGYKGKKALRQDAVKYFTAVVSGSHQEMADLFKQGRGQAWVNANLKFMQEEFGKENIMSATLHMDEKTPHIHFIVVPLTKDGRLSARDVIGSRGDLSKRQDRYAQAMQSFGLERGLKGSKARHTTEGWYIAKQKESQAALVSPLDKLSFFEKANPFKKIEVLTEGLQLANNHKLDAEMKAEREEKKYLQAREEIREYSKKAQAAGQQLKLERERYSQNEKALGKALELVVLKNTGNITSHDTMRTASNIENTILRKYHAEQEQKQAERQAAERRQQEDQGEDRPRGFQAIAISLFGVLCPFSDRSR